MTDKQRHFFFVSLWPKACRAQRWAGSVACEVKRREVVREATKGATDSMRECNQNQLTAVFNLVKHLGNPNNLQAARLVANPDEAAAQDECFRLIWKINQLGFASEYVQTIAAWDCREAQVTRWVDLPASQLRTVLIHVNKRLQEKKAAESEPGAPRVYQMKKFTPAVRETADSNPY